MNTSSTPDPGPVNGLYKILVVGDLGVGKTSIIKMAVHNFFSPHYRATIGVDFALKVYNNWENTKRTIRLQLWDIAGQERLGNMTKVYYKEAVGAIVVFDLARLATFEAVQTWKADLDSKALLPNGKPIPVILMANKCDVDNDFNFDQLDEYCNKHKFLSWFRCSAKENTGIDASVRTLTKEIIAQDDSIGDLSTSIESPSPLAIAAQGTIQEASSLLERRETEPSATETDGLEYYKQLAVREREEKRAVITKLEHLVADLNLCRDTITRLQGKCEYYQSLAEQFQTQLQHTVQLYQESKSEVIQCTQEKLVVDGQLQRAQRVQQSLNERLVMMEGLASKESPPTQPIDQSMLEPYSITPTHEVKLDKKIGQGCYGSVYALRVNGDQCIGKRLLDILVGRNEEEEVEQNEKDKLHEKFLRECYLLCRMNHTNIVEFKGVIFGRDKYDLTLLMEQLDTDLRKYLQKNQNIELKSKVSILHDISKGLLYLHQQFVIHHNLTAANILLTSSLQAKIADLGVSRLVDQSLSKFSTVPETLAYMPPEALKGQTLYNKSLDIFSLGVIILYTGIQEFPKFTYEHVPDVIYQKGECEIYKRRVWIKQLDTQYPELGFITKWCLHDNPAGRPTTECVNIILEELQREHYTCTYSVETNSTSGKLGGSISTLGQ